MFLGNGGKFLICVISMKLKEFEDEKDKTLNKVHVRQLINFDNTENIKVSVVVPIFNVETYLPQCLDSVLNQTLEDIEVICVNDGSTDGSLEILKDYLSRDKRIKIINKDNAGYGHTMNIGMDMASGEYIAIVESDDYILPTMLEVLYNTANDNNLDFVKSDFYRFYGEGDTFIKEYHQIDKSGKYYGKLFSTCDNQEAYKFLMNTWTGLYKTSFLRENCIRHFETPGASYQDNGFWFKTFFYGKRVMIVNQPFYMYRRDNPNSSVKNKEKVYAMDKEYDLIYGFLEDSENKESFLQALTFAKYNNFHFTMDRIDLEFKEEFLKSTSKNFNKMKDNGELRPDLLEEYDQHILNWIIEDPDKYYKYMYQINTDNYNILRKFLECRIDIKNYGNESNDIMVLDYDDPLCIITQPKWFNNKNGVGTVVNSTSGSLNFSFKCVNDGNLEIKFKGIDYRDRNNRRIKIYIDYTEIIIDDEILVSGSNVAWHDDPFVYKKDVKDGQIVNAQIRWKPLNTESDLKTQTDYEKMLKILSECRIDVKNYGKENNSVNITNINNPECIVSQPNWLKNNQGIGSVVNSTGNDLKFSIKCIGDGKLTLKFRAIDYRDKNGKRIPILINYDNIQINGETLVQGSRVSWHDDPFVYNKDVKDGEIIDVQLKWSPLNYDSTVKAEVNERNVNYLKSMDDMKNIEISQLNEEIKRITQENQKLKEFKEITLNSHSWKLTGPLRKLKNLKH